MVQLVIVQFPEAFIELGREVHQHPALMEILNNQEIKEFEIFIAQIAAYCQIALDDIYTQEDLVKIAELCIRRLQGKRVILLH